jgi:hypothetical protein
MTAGEAGFATAGAGGEGGQGRCTLVIGPAATGEWFTHGFERRVHDEQWEIIYPGYIENWADRHDPVFQALPESACDMNADNPDRIVYQLYTRPEDWGDWVSPEDIMGPIDDSLVNLKAKYPGLEEVDILLPLTTEENLPCDPTNPRGSTVGEAVDFLQSNIGGPVPLVFLPRFYAPSCSVYAGGGPELTDAGSAQVAALYGQYFAKHP